MAAIECLVLSRVYDRQIVALSDITLAIPSAGSVRVLGESRVEHTHVRMVFLSWLALTLYSFTQGDAWPWLALPLAPLSAAYTLAAVGFSIHAFVGLFGAAIYVVGLTSLAQ